MSIDRSDLSTLQILTLPIAPFVLADVPRSKRESDLNPRVGVSWNLPAAGAVRAVAQKWRRPASISTLGPVDTEGVAVNDRLPMPGGLYQRARLQLDGAFSSHFLQMFVDRERIDNGVGGIPSIVPAIDLAQLEALRNRRDVFTAVSDLEETPQFAQGRVDTFGVAGNFLVSRRQSVTVRYLRRNNPQSGANDGLAIPFVPRDMLRVASHWTLPDRWLAGVSATYRSRRFRDDVNTQLLEDGWSLGLLAYWESEDKRASVQGILDNILSDRNGAIEGSTRLTLRYAYKF
jgi:hypothetical protein